MSDRGNDIELKPFDTSIVTDEYLDWLGCPQINKFLEVRRSKITKGSLFDYVEATISSESTEAFAIIDKKTKLHIGNIKLDSIDLYHERAEVGLLIGNREFWGRGVATKAIELISDYAFKKRNLRKLTAGIYEGNIGSCKAFQGAGFILEARLEKHWRFEDGFQDGLIFSKFSNN